MADRLVLIGAGNMGGALLSGWIDADVPFEIVVVDPGAKPDMRERMAAAGVHHAGTVDGLAAADYLVIAVKPQMMGTVLPGLVPLVGADTIIISVAAGTSLATLAQPFATFGGVVRVMPNTPALVGRGMSVCVSGPGVSAARRNGVTTLMAAVGDVAWIEDEGDMDAVTGVSGSGPAYVFHMAEALTAAGEAAGLSPALAAQLAQGTITGAAELMRRSDDDPATLRRNVTSPNGTTQAGLEVLMAEDGLTPLLTRTVAAAAERSRALSKE